MKKVIAITAACGLAAALSVTVFADSFVSSIQQKLSPAAKESFVISENGEKTVVPSGEIVVRVKTDADEKTAEILDNAFNAIKNAKSMSDAIGGFDDYLKQNQIANADTIVVRDLFYVSFTGKTAQMVQSENTKVTIRLELKLPEDTFVCAAVFVENQWEMVPKENIAITKDGDLNLVLEQEGAVAVMTQKH